MPTINQLYTAIPNDVITAARWNNEFGNIYDYLNTLAREITGTPAAGDLIYQDAGGSLARLPVGARGSVLMVDASALPEWLPVGTANQVLTSDGTDVEWTDNNAFVTGDIKATFSETPSAGWVMLDNSSIGSASSGATGRANADTEDLYTLLWNNLYEEDAPVTGGRGASAAADFAANKAMRLPRALGCVLAAASSSVNTDYEDGTAPGQTGHYIAGTTNEVNITNNTLEVPDGVAYKWVTGCQIRFVLTSGTITGLTSGTTYFVINASDTTIKLAATFEDAMSGTAVDMTAKASPIWYITNLFPQHALGSVLGEYRHRQTRDELVAHTHVVPYHLDNFGSGNGTPWSGETTTNSNSTGGSEHMSMYQPTLFVNYMIRL